MGYFADKYKNHPDPAVRERAMNWDIAIGIASIGRQDNGYTIVPDDQVPKKTRDIIYRQIYMRPEFDVKDLCAILKLSPDTVRYHLRRLVSDGWIRRKKAEWQALKPLP